MMTDSFLDYLRFEKNYSEKTIVSYGIDLTKFEEYFSKPKTEFTPVVLSFPSKERCDRGGSDVENHWTEK